MHVRKIILPLLFISFSYISAASASGFTDVKQGVPFSEAIEALKAAGFIQGYSDGSFRPYRTLNRAEFVKILSGTLKGTSRGCMRGSRSIFKDVPAKAWFRTSVCEAKERGLVKGFKDGTFRPSAPITLAEAASILSAAFHDVREGTAPWYKGPLSFLAEHGAIPLSLGNPNQAVRRGEFAEILWRLQQDKRDFPSTTLTKVLTAQCKEIMQPAIAHVDMNEVSSTWLQWINDARAENNLSFYSLDRQLERTALIWSKLSKERGVISHKREENSSYYDYKRIEQWFEDLGLTFKNISRTTFTENIGTGYYTCNKTDCTSEFLKAIRTTFDFYMAEKNKESRAHYNSIMNPNFERIGVGIALDEAKHKYYITTHYGTQITSDPAPVCM